MRKYVLFRCDEAADYEEIDEKSKCFQCFERCLNDRVSLETKTVVALVSGALGFMFSLVLLIVLVTSSSKMYS